MRARYPGRCQLCGQPIVVGAAVVNRNGAWLHRRCADSTATVTTDRCGVPTGRDQQGPPCRNPVVPGDLCGVHRWDGRIG